MDGLEKSTGQATYVQCNIMARSLKHCKVQIKRHSVCVVELCVTVIYNKLLMLYNIDLWQIKIYRRQEPNARWSSCKVSDGALITNNIHLTTAVLRRKIWVNSS
jgi:hypothetical protein